jgi:hypothetical protein
VVLWVSNRRCKEKTKSKNPKEELVHFGDLCCCKGTVKGISDYHLPSEIEMLYISNKKLQPIFERMQEHTTMQWQCVLSLHNMVGATGRTITKWILCSRQVENFSGELGH